MRFVRRVVAAALVAPVFLVAACNDDPEPRFEESPSAAPTPTPTGTAEPEPWEEKSEDGAVAFAEHWIEVFNQAQSTGETSDLKSLGTDRCDSCRNFADLLDDLYGEGGRFEGKGWEVLQSAPTRGLSRGEAVVSLRVSQSPERIYRPGEKVERHPGGKVTYNAELLWRDGGWLMDHLFFMS